MNLRNHVLSVALLVFVVSSGAFGQTPFTSITIGDMDGFGLGSAPGLYSANKINTYSCDDATYYMANVDSLSLLRQYDYLPDIDLLCEYQGNQAPCNRHTWWTCGASTNYICVGTREYPGDDWDNREDEELNNNALAGSGYVDASRCTGSNYTDLTLSRSFSDSFPLIPFPTGVSSNPVAGTCLGSPSTDNQPIFFFDFKVPVTGGGLSTSIPALYMSLLIGDYDVGKIKFRISPQDTGVSQITLEPIVLQHPDQDGLIQPVFLNLLDYYTFNQIFTTVSYLGAQHYRCRMYVEVLDGPRASGDPNTNGDPYTSFDFCQISVTEPPFCILRVGPTRPYLTIQSAINASSDGYTIIVDEGTYTGNISFGGRNIVVRSTNPWDPDVVDNTIIQGTGSGSVVTFNGSETGRCHLSGFTITGGSATYGGGIYGALTHANVSFCDIIENNATIGAGMYNFAGPVMNCLFQSNIATSAGGGMYNCKGEITDCAFLLNDGGYYGGAAYNCDHFDRCFILGNQADYLAGGLYLPIYVLNCVLVGNQTTTTTYNYGAGLHSTSSTAYIVHNTIAVNTGGTNNLNIKTSTSATLVNNIVYGNGNEYSTLSSYARYCLLTGGPATPDARGNFYGNPSFVFLFDYHLTSSSAAINAGDPSMGVRIDLDSNPRDATPDVGAYEYIP